MINTLKESSLHKTIKNMYALEEGSVTEAECDGHIYDILTKNGNVIEIQTQNLGKLLKKTEDVLSRNREIKIVHPVAVHKQIELYNEKGELLKTSRSTKKGNEYTVLKELCGLYPILLKENFTLELLLVNTTEKRIKKDQPEQSENKQRRFKKDWQKTDKILKEIIKSKTFSSKKDYLDYLPDNLPQIFTTRDIKEGLKNDPNKPKTAWKYAGILAWLLAKMNLISQTGLKGKTKLYEISKD